MEQEQKLHESQDVVVVGAGVGGLTAAIAAAEAGAKTIVLDKNADIKSTNTYRAGGNISVAPEKELNPNAPRPTPEERAAEALGLTGGNVDVELIKTWHQNILTTVSWLEKTGLKWTPKPSIHAPPGRSKQVEGGGPGLNRQLLHIAEKMSCQVLFNTKVTKLLTNTKGWVAGVKTQTGQGLKDFESKSVVLATAGFQANQEMLLKYFGPEFTYKVKLTGSTCATGDGHIMAQEVGAKLVNMDQFHPRCMDGSWVPGSSGMPGPHRALWGIVHYAIFINKLGKRFMDETSGSDNVACSIMRQPGAEVAFVFDQKIKATRPDEVDGYRPGIIMTASTIEELATKIEVPYPELKKTISEFNSAVIDGKALNLDVPKKACAWKIETPPFYAVYPVWSGLNCTLGGPKITPQAQVVDRDDIPIPGLYAAGEMIGGFFFGRYITTNGGATFYQGNHGPTTSSISAWIVFSRLAGINAAKSKPG